MLPINMFDLIDITGHSWECLKLFVGLLIFILLTAAVTLSERKFLGSSQRRKGPNMVGFSGILQPIADALKLLQKEFVVPGKADNFMFLLPPIFILFFSFIPWLMSPITEGVFVFKDLVYGVLLMFCMSSLGSFCLMISGWAGNSRYSFLGGLRSVAQLIVFEIFLGLLLFPIIMDHESLCFQKIVENQESLIDYGCFQFLVLIVVFLIGFAGEMGRTPFDLPEAESELVSGYNTEYSSMVFSLFFLAEYGHIVFFSYVNVLLFFGGYNFPAFNDTMDSEVIGHSLFRVVVIFGFKVALLTYVIILMRAALVRYRFDQLMELGWKIMFPACLAIVFIMMLVVYIFRL